MQLTPAICSVASAIGPGKPRLHIAFKCQRFLPLQHKAEPFITCASKAWRLQKTRPPIAFQLDYIRRNFSHMCGAIGNASEHTAVGETPPHKLRKTQESTLDAIKAHQTTQAIRIVTRARDADKRLPTESQFLLSLCTFQFKQTHSSMATPPPPVPFSFFFVL